MKTSNCPVCWLVPIKLLEARLCSARHIKSQWQSWLNKPSSANFSTAKILFVAELQTRVGKLRFLTGKVQRPSWLCHGGNSQTGSVFGPLKWTTFLVTPNPESAGLSVVIWVGLFLCFEADFWFLKYQCFGSKTFSSLHSLAENQKSRHNSSLYPR